MSRKTSKGGSIGGRLGSKSDIGGSFIGLQPVAAVRLRYAEAIKPPEPPAPVRSFKDMTEAERQEMIKLYGRKT